MKRIALILMLSAFAAAASAQTAAKTSSTSSAKPKTASTAAATAHKTTTAASTLEPWIKLPPGVPRIAHGPVRIPFSLRYEDIKIGTGAEGEPGKLWHIKYTGWRAADGVKFDSWEDHKQLAVKDGKPVMGPDGKPTFKDPEPLEFPQGVGRVIPGFDWGLAGMKIGGERRVFIPWQLAYGTHDIPDRPGHPGIPAKSDLIFDVELVAVTDMPQPPQRPVMPGVPPHPGAAPVHPAEPAKPVEPTKKPAEPSAKPAETVPAQPAAPSQPTAAPQQM
jgi:peptidylprolyl isomerase